MTELTSPDTPMDLSQLRQQLIAMERQHPTQYVLDATGQPVPEPDPLAWALWLEQATDDGSRVVAQETGCIDGAEVFVSTIFLGISHSFGAPGAPVLWETMVFVEGRPDEVERYTSRTAAEAGHAAWVAEVLRRPPESLEAFRARLDGLLARLAADAQADTRRPPAEESPDARVDP